MKVKGQARDRTQPYHGPDKVPPLRLGPMCGCGRARRWTRTLACDLCHADMLAAFWAEWDRVQGAALRRQRARQPGRIPARVRTSRGRTR